MAVATKQISRLAKIEVADDSSPFDLFQKWFQSANEHYSSFSLRSMNIATVSKEGVVSNRFVQAQEIDDEGVLFNTTRRSRKHLDIQNHPQVAITFNWTINVNDDNLSLQVRMEGVAKEMDIEFTRERFRSASFRTQLRMAFCKQGNEIDWDELKQRHEKFLLENANQELDMPPDVVYHKIIPHRIEFYQSNVDSITIADRVLFRKNENTKWFHVHLEA